MSYSRPQRDASDVVDTGRTNYSVIQLPEPSSSSGNENNNTVNLEFTEEKYETNHAKRGIAVIFNQVNFAYDKKDKRVGSCKDCESYLTSFSKLNFEVRVHTDLTKHAIEEELKKLASENHKDNDCFVLVIMTYSEENKLHAFDQKFQQNLLWENFLGTKCNSLIDKPKLFFILACQYEQQQSHKGEPSDVVDALSVSPFIIPDTADLLVMNFEGNPSFLNSETGSLYNQTLSNVLDTESSNPSDSNKELLDLLKLVQRQAGDIYKSSDPDNPDTQVPCYMSTLIKDFYFTPKQQ